MAVNDVNRFTSNFITDKGYRDKLREIQDDLEKSSKQIQTGQKYDNYYDMEKIEEVKAAIRTGDSIDSNASTIIALKAASTRLQGASDKVEALKKRLDSSLDAIAKISTPQREEDQNALYKVHAGEMLDFIQTTFNAKSDIDSTYYFSGNAVATKPVQTNLRSQKSGDDYYKGGKENLTYVYKDKIVHYGIKGDEQPFKDLVAAYQDLFNIAGNTERAENIYGRIQTATHQVIQLNAKLGEQASEVEALKSQAEKENIVLKEKLAELCESDPIEGLMKVTKTIMRQNAIAYCQKITQENSVLNNLK